VIREGGEPTFERTVTQGNGTCIATGAAIDGDYIKSESRAGRMSQRLMAIVAKGTKGKSYLPASHDAVTAAECMEPAWKPEGQNPKKLTGGTVHVYGLNEWWKLFTMRQLVALTTFSDLLPEVAEEVRVNAVAANMIADGIRLRDGGAGADAYADTVYTYLAFTIDKCADYWSSVCTWNNSSEAMRGTFGRQAIQMSWDFAEANPFSASTGNWMAKVVEVAKVLERVPALVGGGGHCSEMRGRQSARCRAL